jgi:DNA polymerase-1
MNYGIHIERHKMADNFKDMMEYPANNTMVVDALNLAFRWKHQGRSDFRYEFQKTVESLAQSYKASKIIIAADWGSSTYRKALDPEYKADRKAKYKDQTPEEKIAFEEFFEEFEVTLELLAGSYTVLRYKGVEADDIAAHLVVHKEQYELENIWLISSDRDWDLLCSADVSRFSYVTRKEVTLANWSDHYDVAPEEYISLKCLMGDKGDNVAGIVGIGPKRAEGLIREYGTAFDVYDACPIDSKYKYIQSLNENYERILLNYELMDLVTYCDDAIGEENIQDIREQMGDVPW